MNIPNPTGASGVFQKGGEDIMLRERGAETSPVYGSFLVSLLSRSVELMGTSGQDPRQAVTLDKALESMFLMPEIKELAGTKLGEIKTISAARWRRGTRKFFRDYAELYSTFLREQGQPDPLHGLPLHKKISYLLTELGWEGNFNKIPRISKKWFTDALEVIVTGEKKTVAEWSKGITSGLFEDDPETAVAIIRFSLMAGGGNKLLQEIDDAVKTVRDRLISLPEFQAAVELVEKRQKWGGSESDSKFRETWNSLKPRVTERMRRKGLAIPRVDGLSDLGKKDWSEEEVLAMETVFNELFRRASENPLKLIADAWNGKLGNSLVVSVENDLRDEIRRLRAQKRDVAKEEILDEERATHPGKVHAKSIRDSKVPLDKLIENENYNQLMSQLTGIERTIVTMKVEEGLKQDEIARRMGKSQAWVSGKLKGIQEKLRPFSRG